MKEIITNIVLALIILVLIMLPIIYIIKTRSKGQKCIGCPYSKTCSNQNNCSCSKNKN